MENGERKKKRALVIGINRFPGLVNSDGKSFDLKGCVNDAEAMSQVLTEGYGFTVSKLLNEQATQQGILGALDRLVEETQPGDIVTLFCASHGTRMRAVAGTKASGFEEAIVPHDAHRSHGRYENLISETQLRQRLNRLAELTPYVSLIFDCCHSATLHRNTPDLVAAGMVLGASRFVEPPEEFDRGGEQVVVGNEAVLCAELLPDASSYVILAACRNDQTAGEVFLRATGIHRGRFSFHLTHELTEAARNAVSFRDLMERVGRNFNGTGKGDQQPQFEGAVDRHLFERTETPFVRHTMARVAGQVVKLEAGAVHGIVTGSRWNLYPVAGSGQASAAAAVVEKVDGFEASARLTSGAATGRLRAVEIGRPEATRVRVGVHATNDPQAEQRAVAALIDSPLVVGVAGDAEAPLQARLLPGPAGLRWAIYEGSAPQLVQATPPDRSDCGRLRSLLEAVAHARQLVTRRNDDADTDLAKQMKVELISAENKTNSLEAPGTLKLLNEEVFRLKVKNYDLAQDVYVLVLKVDANMQVQQIYPPANAPAQALAKGSEVVSRWRETLTDPLLAETCDYVIFVTSSAILATQLLQRGMNKSERFESRTTTEQLGPDQRWTVFHAHLQVSPRPQ